MASPESSDSSEDYFSPEETAAPHTIAAATALTPDSRRPYGSMYEQLKHMGRTTALQTRAQQQRIRAGALSTTADSFVPLHKRRTQKRARRRPVPSTRLTTGVSAPSALGFVGSRGRGIAPVPQQRARPQATYAMLASARDVSSRVVGKGHGSVRRIAQPQGMP